MKKIIIISLFAGILLGIFASYKYSNDNILTVQRGCCSHHGGVCGCAGGRSKCCDGTLSPSCQCFKDDIKSGLEL